MGTIGFEQARANEFGEYLEQRIDCSIDYAVEGGKEGWRISTDKGSIFISFRTMCFHQLDYIYKYWIEPELI